MLNIMKLLNSKGKVKKLRTDKKILNIEQFSDEPNLSFFNDLERLY